MGSKFSDTSSIILHSIPKTPFIQPCTHFTHTWIRTYTHTNTHTHKRIMGTFWICSVVILAVGAPFNSCGDCCISILSYSQQKNPFALVFQQTNFNGTPTGCQAHSHFISYILLNTTYYPGKHCYQGNIYYVQDKHA